MSGCLGEFTLPQANPPRAPPAGDYSRPVASRLRNLATEERYGEALLLLAVFYLVGDVGVWMARVADLVFILILLLIISNPAVPRSLKVIAYAASAVSATLTLTRAYDATQATVALDAASTLLVVIITILAVLRRLLQHSVVDASTVMGAFLCYAMIGFGSAFLYITVDALTAEPFFTQGQQPEANYIYFSIVTLTTVGYGDLTAGTALARRLVVIEALVGQVFLVVLVARLVSLWKAPQHRIGKRD